MEVEYLSYWDLVLVPLYLITFYFILAYIKKKNPENKLIQGYLIKGFYYKIALAIFLCLFIYFSYGYGDTMSYFREAMKMKRAIHSGDAQWSDLLQDHQYVQERYDITSGANSGWLVERMVIVLSYFGFDSFIIITMLFAALSYAGMFKLFETFTLIAPNLHFRIALITIFFPSVTIYGSGILKDTICISALGWIVYHTYQMFLKNSFRIRSLLVIVICCILIANIKVYILAAFLIPLLIFSISSLLGKMQSKILRVAILPLLLMLFTVLYLYAAPSIEKVLGHYATENLVKNISDQQKNYRALEEEAGSNFEIGPMEESLSGLIKRIPAGIVATLYRPFIWESRNIMMLFTAIESLLLLLYSVYVLFRVGILRFIFLLFTNPFIFFCFSFTLLFAAFVGVSTLNFGTLARYRIPILPFYAMGLIYMRYIYLVEHKKHSKLISGSRSINS